MATYIVNNPGSNDRKIPANFKPGDKMVINYTGTGTLGYVTEWKVASDGVYTIEAWGAQGGGTYGGKGARIKGDFNLKANQIIRLSVGHQGGLGDNGTARNEYQGGGGGGSFVVRDSRPLLIAAGGGGQSSYSSNKNIPGRDGDKEMKPTNVVSGPAWNGNGYGGNSGGSTGGAGGAGFITSGYPDKYEGTRYGSPGSSYTSNLYGGSGYVYSGSGGYGGGGGCGFSGGGGGGGYTGGHGGGNSAAFSAQGAGSYNEGVNQSNASGIMLGSGKIEITFIGSANEPPTKPSFTKQPVSKSINLSNDIIPLEWSASTDPEGNPITYEIDFYNGTTWVSIATKITVTKYDCMIPSVGTDKAQLRVRATDSENGASEYALSNVFTVAKRLYIIKDGDTSKTYKNGTWELI